MTITALPARNEYISAASQIVFNYTFKIFSSTDLNVYVTPPGQSANDAMDITTSYTVDSSTIGDESGGFITFNAGVAEGSRVTIVSDVPESRTTDYQVNGDFVPETVNNDFDRVVQIAKQINDFSSRTLTFPQSQQNAQGLTLSEPSAGRYLRWNPAEDGIENAGAPSVVVNPENAGVATDMISAIDSVAGTIYTTTGRLSPGDGGDSNYLCRAVTAAADDGGSILKSVGDPSLEFVNLFPGGRININMWGAGNGVANSSPAIAAAFDYVGGGGTIHFDGEHSYVMGTFIDNTNASNLVVEGNGCTLINTVDPVNAQMLEFSDSDSGPASLLNFSFRNFFFNNNGHRSRVGQVVFRRPNCSVIENINVDSNSFASTAIELIDPFCATVRNIQYEASGGGIAVKLQGETLNISTVLIENVFCSAGTAVFLGAEPAAGVAQLIETTTMTNIHAVRATGTPPQLADESNVNGSGAGASSVFVGVGPSASFLVGQKILMGDVGRLEHNYIQNIVSGFLELRYPTIRAAGVGSRIVGGDVGIIVSGQSTYNTKLINPHIESMGIGIFTSDTKLFQCEGLLASGYIEGIRCDAMREGRLLDTSSFASASSSVLYNLSNIVSLGTGLSTERMVIDGILDIGGTIVPNKVVNNSGNPILLNRQDGSNFYILGGGFQTSLNFDSVPANGVRKYTVPFPSVAAGDTIVGSVVGGINSDVNVTFHVLSTGNIQIVASNPTAVSQFEGLRNVRITKLLNGGL